MIVRASGFRSTFTFVQFLRTLLIPAFRHDHIDTDFVEINIRQDRRLRSFDIQGEEVYPPIHNVFNGWRQGTARNLHTFVALRIVVGIGFQSSVGKGNGMKLERRVLLLFFQATTWREAHSMGMRLILSQLLVLGRISFN